MVVLHMWVTPVPPLLTMATSGSGSDELRGQSKPKRTLSTSLRVYVLIAMSVVVVYSLFHNLTNKSYRVEDLALVQW